MGEASATSEPTRAGFLADAVWFLYSTVSVGVLTGLFSAVVYWTFNLLT